MKFSSLLLEDGLNGLHNESLALSLLEICCCRHRILYSLRLGLSFPNDAEILRPKVGLGPNQITN